MGEYTGLRLTADLSPQGVEVVSRLMTTRAWAVAVCGLDEMPSTDEDAIDEWLALGRVDFIPFGASAYLDGEYDIAPEHKGTRWSFGCSLKNYEDEIEGFLSHVLPWLIARPCVAHTRLEAEEEETRHVIDPRV